ncbi:MAG: hypothetical protein ACOCUD_04835 [Bacillota bacterium]
MNRDKRDNLNNTFDELKLIVEENTSSTIEDENKANESELTRLQEENRKLRETIVEIAVELYSRNN